MVTSRGMHLDCDRLRPAHWAGQHHRPAPRFRAGCRRQYDSPGSFEDLRTIPCSRPESETPNLNLANQVPIPLFGRVPRSTTERRPHRSDGRAEDRLDGRAPEELAKAPLFDSPVAYRHGGIRRLECRLDVRLSVRIARSEVSGEEDAALDHFLHEEGLEPWIRLPVFIEESRDRAAGVTRDGDPMLQAVAPGEAGQPLPDPPPPPPPRF